MMADSYYNKPQRGNTSSIPATTKFYEAYHLLKFSNEKRILEKKPTMNIWDLKKANLWGNRKYFFNHKNKEAVAKSLPKIDD